MTFSVIRPKPKLQHINQNLFPKTYYLHQKKNSLCEEKECSFTLSFSFKSCLHEGKHTSGWPLIFFTLLLHFELFIQVCYYFIQTNKLFTFSLHFKAKALTTPISIVTNYPNFKKSWKVKLELQTMQICRTVDYVDLWNCRSKVLWN